MRWYHRIGMTVIDKLILVLMLFLTVLDVSEGLTNIGWDLGLMIMVVSIAYIGVVVFVSAITFFIRTEGRGVDFVKGLVSVLIIWLLFPKILEIGFMLVGVSVSDNVENVLLAAFILRAFVGSYLGRRWRELGD